jgi:hypothetical protein
LKSQGFVVQPVKNIHLFISFLMNPWLSYPSSGDAKHKAQCFNAQKDDGRGENPSTG